MGSNNSMDNKWGAIFGAAQADTTPPTEPKKSGSSADKKKKENSPKKKNAPKKPSSKQTPDDTKKVQGSKEATQSKSDAPEPDKIALKELKRFLTASDGINAFRDNSMELLNGDMTIKKYPNLLDKLPDLPDLEPIIKEYIASKNNNPNSFNMQLQAMMNRESANNRHDYSLMLPKYIQDSIDEIAKIMNSEHARDYPSLVAFQDKYGNGRISRTGLLFAMLGGVFTPDRALQKKGLAYVLNHGKKNSKHIMDELIRHRTITPNNYDWASKDTTTFNFPSNFSTVVSVAMIDNIKHSDLLDIQSKDLMDDKQILSPNSKSIANTVMYHRLQQMYNLRLLINTKLQHILFDKL